MLTFFKASIACVFLFLSACASVPTDGTTPPAAIQSPFSWATFCAVDVPIANFSWTAYKMFAKVSAKDIATGDSLRDELIATCTILPGPSNTADAQARASQTMAQLNAVVANPDAAPAPNVTGLPVKAR